MCTVKIISKSGGTNELIYGWDKHWAVSFNNDVVYHLVKDHSSAREREYHRG